MTRIYMLCLPSLLICLSSYSYGQRRGMVGGSDRLSGTTVYYLGLPYAQKDKIFQDLWIRELDTAEASFLWVECWDLGGEDSVLISRIRLRPNRWKSGKPRHIRYRYIPGADSAWIHKDYAHVLRSQGRLPAGPYRVSSRIHYPEGILYRSFSFVVDSALSPRDRAYRLFEGVAERGLRRIPSARRESVQIGQLGAGTWTRFSRRMATEGFETVDQSGQGVKRQSIYYKGRFMGYMEWKEVDSWKDYASLDPMVPPARIPLDVDQRKPLFSQFRENSSPGQEDKALVGQFSVMSHVRDGQEAYGERENKYYDLSGFLEVPILGMDFQLEGYYTSQDRGRSARASYFHWHYDSESAKSRLMDLISRYRSQYVQSSASLGAIKGVYEAPLSRWKEERRDLLSSFQVGGQDFSLDSSGLYASLVAEAKSKADTFPGVGVADSGRIWVEQVQRDYGRLTERWVQLQELESRVLAAESMLEGWQQRQHGDSLLAYDRLKDLDMEKMSSLSYRQLSQKASGMGGSPGWWRQGLQRLDLGIFSHHLSSYTLDGQRLQGADMEYDLGAVGLGMSYGRIGYVDRQGNEDHYQGYSGRLRWKSWEGHRTELIYLGYSPSRSLISGDSFFREADIHMPSFSQGSRHIVSLVHRGHWGDRMQFGGEVASSSSSSLWGDSGESLAWKVDAGGRIGGSGLEYRGEYEKVGKNFENHTLLMSYRGMERFGGGLSGDFFGRFLHWEVDYHHLRAQGISHSGRLSKWGFLVRTESRRYPRLSVSYKPFTTYRSFDDTSVFQQTLILGSVWTGQLSYSWKRQDHVWRFHSVYHRHRSWMDTVYSGGDMGQVQVHYTRAGGLWGLMLIGSQMTMEGSGQAPLYGRQRLFSGSGHYRWGRGWQFSGSQELGFRDFGRSRYGAGLGLGYVFSRIPLSLRASFRYQTFRWEPGTSWQRLHSGMISLQWQFRIKLKDSQSGTKR